MAENPTVVPEAQSSAQDVSRVQSQVGDLIAEILEYFNKVKDKQAQGQEQEQEGSEGAEKKPRSVEIQIGKQKVFKGTEGQEPDKNTLTAEQTSALKKLVNTPSTEEGHDLDSSVQSLGRVITVRVDKEPVLRVANGQLDNKLEPESQPEQTLEPQSVAQPETQPVAQPSPATSTQNSSRFPEIPEDFGIPAARGINTDKVLATGDQLLSRSYLSLETIRQDLNDSYRRGSNPGYEFIATAPHVAPLRERFEAEKANFETRLNIAIEKGTYQVPPPAPEQTKPSLVDLAQDLEAKTSAQETVQPAPENNLSDQDKQSLADLEKLFRPRSPEQAQSQAEVAEPPETTQPSKYQTILPDIPDDFGIPEAQGMTSEKAEELGGPSLKEAFEALNEQRNIIQTTRNDHNKALEDPEQSASDFQTHHIESFWDSKKLDRYEDLKQDFSQQLSAALEKQGAKDQLQPETQPKERASFGEVMAKDMGASFSLPPETVEWFKETSAALKQGAKDTWAKLKSKSKELAATGVRQAKELATSRVNQAHKQLENRKAADTAVKLLNSDPQGRLFQGENYTITAVNRHTISVTDAEQKEILRFEETALGPKIINSDLTPKQLKEFAQTRGQIQKHGVENLLNTQPSARMQFLQGFAPVGDRAEVQKIHNSNTIGRVEQIAATLKPTATGLNSETHELGEYSIQRNGSNLQVTHQERGVILSRTNGEVQGNLSDRDIAHFRGLATRTAELVPAGQQLGQQQAPVAVSGVPTPTQNQAQTQIQTPKPQQPNRQPDIEIGD